MSLSAEKLIAYVEERAGVAPGTITTETLLFTTSILDSLSLVDLIVFVESHMDGRVDPDDVMLENFDSVARILAYAASKGSTGG